MSNIAGNELTVSDIALGNAINRWFALKTGRPELPNLRAWYERLCERPAYRKVIMGQREKLPIHTDARRSRPRA
ncbi:MAG: hypothetical protein A3F74_25465 [Betaproteobacteria bacterium RIFCSPLOWO2_12_FULL_62_58]|nr:MAG: hypothetical protein A3F74_25465 [Betaproteobacteria bacterium RIFCSPLOWO2_12_FULL_62_58]